MVSTFVGLKNRILGCM